MQSHAWAKWWWRVPPRNPTPSNRKKRGNHYKFLSGSIRQSRIGNSGSACKHTGGIYKWLKRRGKQMPSARRDWKIDPMSATNLSSCEGLYSFLCHRRRESFSWPADSIFLSGASRTGFYLPATVQDSRRRMEASSERRDGIKTKLDTRCHPL